LQKRSEASRSTHFAFPPFAERCPIYARISCNEISTFSFQLASESFYILLVLVVMNVHRRFVRLHFHKQRAPKQFFIQNALKGICCHLLIHSSELTLLSEKKSKRQSWDCKHS
jgi:hypothetical protein